MDEEKKDFLLVMYKEMFNNIDRHITMAWQTVSLLATFVTAILLIEKFKLPVFVGVYFLMILYAWYIARLIDAEHWYERNIHIISNIEKQFLSLGDAKEIHYYYTKQRSLKKNNLDSVTMQIVAILLLWGLTFFYYMTKVFFTEPEFASFSFFKLDFNQLIEQFCSWEKFTYLLIYLTITIIALYRLKKYKYQNNIAILKLRKRSPGKNIKNNSYNCEITNGMGSEII